MVHAAFFGFWLLLGAGYAFAVMQPIFTARRTAKSAGSFCRMDVLWLLVLLQWPLIFLTLTRRWHANETARVLSLGAVLVLVVVALWLGFTSHLSQMRIHQTNRRGIFLVVVVPVTIVGSLTLGPVAILTTYALNFWRADTGSLDRSLLITAFLVLIGGGMVSRLLNQWVVRGASHDDN